MEENEMILEQQEDQLGETAEELRLDPEEENSPQEQPQEDPDQPSIPEPEGQEESDLCGRLAQEFGEISELLPEIRSFSDLPDEVIRSAVREGHRLFDAYLRYQFAQGRARAAEQQAQERAAAHSAGRMHSDPEEGGGDLSALLDGIWR
ncbi:MAG: hypothetical protein IJY82_03235 [Oscillospiraceae bacterium]|nr:hypothetical protein [Oscillospiraceae bacterium]